MRFQGKLTFSQAETLAWVVNKYGDPRVNTVQPYELSNLNWKYVKKVVRTARPYLRWTTRLQIDAAMATLAGAN